jgi:hypothetical protein
MKSANSGNKVPRVITYAFARLHIFVGLLLGVTICLAQSASSQDSFLNINLTTTSAQSDVLALSGTNIASLSSWSDDQLTTLVNALDATPTISASDLPNGGMGLTCWSLQNPKMPPLPGDLISVSAWQLSDGSFLLNDADYDYNTVSGSTVTASPMTMSAMDGGVPSLPGTGDGNTNSTPDGLMEGIYVNYGTNLWIAETAVSSGYLTGIGSNTLAGVVYTIQSVTNLAQAQNGWQSEGSIVGSGLTNWTALSVVRGNRTNLFVRLRSEFSSDGSGIPVWWENLYFGTNFVNPDALDSIGDGYTIYQKYLLGVAPNTWFAPPAPQSLSAALHLANKTAVVSWVPSPAATGYTLEKTDSYNYPPTVQDIPLSSTSISYTDSLSGNDTDPYYGNNYDVSYRIMANYSGGHTSSWSGSIPLQQITVTAAITPAASGVTALAVSGVPPNAAAVQLVYIDVYAVYGGDTSQDYNKDIPVSSFTNGVYYMPTASFVPTNGDVYYIYAESVDASGNPSGASLFDTSDEGADTALNAGAPFYDGRVQLKQNLIFQLRAAAMDASFHFSIYSYPSNCASASLYDFANSEDYYGTFDTVLPFRENNLFRNFVFNITNVDSSGALTTGVSGGGSPPDYYNLYNPTFQFNSTLPVYQPVLATNQAKWWLYDQSTASDDLGGEGIINFTTDGSGNVTVSMASGKYNWFGLPYTSINIVVPNGSGGLITNVVSAGHSSGNGEYSSVPDNIYIQTALPGFRTSEYDFWVQLTEFDLTPPLPGDSAFSPTNKSQLLITPVADSYFQIAGYAKLAVTNSVYSGVYGYLGQYFTNAYMVDTNGNVTTNKTGILSPYGNFFATQPGTVALVTMPDPDTGAQGTGIVYCISLNVDKNHDGDMDLSFDGLDTTSTNSPCVFWANNNYDRWTPDEDDNTNYMDDVQSANNPGTSVPEPDCNYSNRLANGYSYRAIPCTRDLEDYARLWVCGITTNLVAALPAGSTITLSWGDVGSPDPANPTIDLFTAADANGGIGYLTNATVAALQTNAIASPYIGRLGPGGSIQLNASQFANQWAGNYFIWCGVSYGNGGLNLTIADGSGNLLAQTTAYIQIVDIKQMYEQWTVGDNPNIPPTNVACLASENLPPGVPSFEYPLPQNTNTPYVLLVHGWNVQVWEKDRFAETALKRLYWQGYQGRFGEFRWPTTFLNPTGNSIADDIILANIYDPGEYNAWNSATGLLNSLATLNATYSNNVYLLAHSMGNVVAGEALRLAAQQGLGRLVNTYVASQAAVPGHCYDSTLTGSDLLGFEGGLLGPTTANIYNNWLATNSAAAGRRINFYNTNDYALSSTHWQLDEEVKPDSVIGIHPPYGYNGSPSDNPPLQNGFYGTSPAYIGSELTLYLGSTSSVLNRYEITAFAAEPRSLALGATPDVHTVTSILNLATVWPPDPSNYSKHFWHSAEFRGDNVQQQGYWNTLLYSSLSGFNISAP